MHDGQEDVSSGLSTEPRVIGVDVGGTFTDFALVDHRPSTLTMLKVASTPSDPAKAVLAGLDGLDPGRTASVAHGTTVATNALLERRGARVAFVTTAGFGDLLRLGRGDRSALYSLTPENRPSLVLDSDIHEVAERLGADGGVLKALTDAEALRVAEAVAASGAESIAICFLHAYVTDEHERKVAAAIVAALTTRGRLDVPVAFSFDVLPEMREFERASTTVMNAYLAPPMRGYIERLAAGARPRRLMIMGSHGGTLLPKRAADKPIATLLSGPAAGVAGALYVAERCGVRSILTFDMGGTSTDVAVCDGAMPLVARSIVDGFPISREMLDVHTVGAGGGSIVRADEVGALRVGPESAGADPGPACYGRGGIYPTITDAHAVLGRLPEGLRLGDGPGSVSVDPAAARQALSPIAERLGIGVQETALVALRVVESNMERALRNMTIERGIDPSELTLVAFGGAGPLHACALAETLGIRSIVLPTSPGALSALGLLVSPRASSAARTVLRRGVGRSAFEVTYDELDRSVLDELFGDLEDRRLRAEAEADVLVLHEADLRYTGQSWEITVPWLIGETVGAVSKRFEAEHFQRYGFRSDGSATEVVTLRSRARMPRPPDLPRAVVSNVKSGPPYRAAVVNDSGRSIDCRVVARSDILVKDALDGPAIITQADSTAWLPEGWRARTLDSLDILLERRASQGV